MITAYPQRYFDKTGRLVFREHRIASISTPQGVRYRLIRSDAGNDSTLGEFKTSAEAEKALGRAMKDPLPRSPVHVGEWRVMAISRDRGQVKHLLLLKRDGIDETWGEFDSETDAQSALAKMREEVKW